MIASINSLPDSFSNDHGARSEILSQDAKAADLRIGRETPNHPRDCGAVSVDISAIAWFNFDLNTGIDHVKVIKQTDSLQSRMLYLYARIDHSNADTFARSLRQSRT